MDKLDFSSQLTDTQLLNFLDACTEEGQRVCIRESRTGRGWRLHAISEHEAGQLNVPTFATVREAILHWTHGANDVLSGGRAIQQRQA